MKKVIHFFIHKKVNLIGLSLAAALFFMAGCSFNMTSYYEKLNGKLESEDYQGAADYVAKNQSKYGDRNALMFSLDAGIVNHYAFIYDVSENNFEDAKNLFSDYYTKSVSAAALSMIYNDSSMPYYGEDFESIHITIFNSLNYILSGQDNEAVVEARQADYLFKGNYRKFYKDDGFVRYFMGLVYENGGYLNDAYVSYSLAINAYEKGITGIKPPADLINDAYTSAVQLGISGYAAQLKSKYPQAQVKNIPKGYGECIVMDYNGIIPKKVERVINIAFSRAWAYASADNVDSSDMEDFQTAQSVALAVLSDDYISVAFPAYQSIPHSIYSFSVRGDSGLLGRSYEAQDLGTIAEKVLNDRIALIYAKTIARAAIKYAAGKAASNYAKEQHGDGIGLLAELSTKLYSSLSERADTRGWHTLPENILMSRFYLPAGENKITVDLIGSNGTVLRSREITVNVKEGKKNFIVLSSPK
ncbi:MAG: hypothetical protein LBB93_05175 [Elusimicrobiota bacterium]|jgi:hypothetical protein|nr:hypothetical protein [Elusimicrobiota bacterium]